MTEVQAARERLMLSESKLLLAMQEVCEAQDALLVAQEAEIRRLSEASPTVERY